MNSDKQVSITPNWSDFSQIWKIVSVVLFLLLLLLWFIGASPWSKNGGACGSNSDNTVSANDNNLPVISEDSMAPVMQLNGDSVIRLSVGSSYIDDGVVVTDNVDGEISAIVTGDVDSKTPGEYILTYTAFDKAGNKATITRQVIVGNKQSGNANKSEIVRSPETVKLYFANASAVLPENSSSLIEEIIDYLQSNSAATVILSGYHSATGSYEYNQRLSKRRAEAVSQLLQNAGVNIDRMILEKPVETTGSGSAAEARRVEISIK